MTRRAEGTGTGSWAYQAGVNVAKPLGAMCRVEKRDTTREGGGPGGGWEDSNSLRLFTGSPCGSRASTSRLPGFRQMRSNSNSTDKISPKIQT
jgi:hypothetical protein